jgi:hypothetical protein
MHENGYTVRLNETYYKLRIGKYLSGTVIIQNDLKQEDVLSPLLFNFVLEYAIGIVQQNQKEMRINRTHQLLIGADDSSL